MAFCLNFEFGSRLGSNLVGAALKFHLQVLSRLASDLLLPFGDGVTVSFHEKVVVDEVITAGTDDVQGVGQHVGCLSGTNQRTQFARIVLEVLQLLLE